MSPTEYVDTSCNSADQCAMTADSFILQGPVTLLVPAVPHMLFTSLVTVQTCVASTVSERFSGNTKQALEVGTWLHG